MTAHLNPHTRHDAILLFDVADGNPNGDPDAANQPRIDPETSQGLVTCACQKRKIRDYVAQVHQSDRNNIFISQNAILNNLISDGYDALELKVEKSAKSGTAEQQLQVQDYLREKYFDIRMFGAVLATGGLKAGQVTGPVQVTFARSIDRVTPNSLSVTRCARANKEEDKENKTMGKKEIIPYGLYKSHVFYNPNIAKNVTSEDMAILWESLVKSWEFNRSASRGFMACRGLYVFSHDSKYGNAPTHELFQLLKIESKSTTPRSISDYEITIGDAPDNITLTRLA